MALNQKVKNKIKESLAAVLPITAIVLLLGMTFVPLENNVTMLFLFGAVFLIVGMGVFQQGAEMAMTPLGEGIGVGLSRIGRTGKILLLTFLMGVIITIAEPDLSVLATQVPAIPDQTLILTVAVGVGLFLALAVFRILFKISLATMLLVFYIGMIVLSFFVPGDFLAVAFDSGGVTTGPVTVPFIMALGVGISSMRGDKNAASDSFGLVALSSVGPILAVMLLGCLFHPSESAVAETVMSEVTTVQDVFLAFLAELPVYAKEVFFSILPILLMFLIFQAFGRHFKRREITKILVGMGYTYLGLVLFLCGVNVGFAPVGSLIGSSLAALPTRFVLVPIGALIGFFIVKAEPAIQVLNNQVEDVTDGLVSATAMNRCLSIGVSVSVGLSMLRILLQIPIAYLLIPGYVIALILSRLVPPMFVGIAFDSGGVASGPMTSTFLLPLSIGACTVSGGNVRTDAFGVVALVALTPLIAIQLMGLSYRSKLKARLAGRNRTIPIPDDADVIVELTPLSETMTFS